MSFRHLLVFFFLCIATFASAQRCKYLVDEKDPITDDIIRTVKNRITGPISGLTPYYYFYYIRSGSDYKIRVEIADYGAQTHSIPKGSELIIRLEDGGLIRINSIEEAQPKELKEVTEVLTGYDVLYQIAEEDMKKIVNSGIVFIRGLDFKNSFSDQKIPTPITKSSKFNAGCIFK